MSTILVTGGTGTLGRPTVDHLRAAGHEVRVLSRRTGPGLITGDLTTGRGIDAAVDGAHTIVHLATGLGRRDVQQARNLLRVPVAHVVVMSIVGIDRIPLPYYRSKLEVERLVAESGTPYTILRATQFHNLLDRIFSLRLPAILAPSVTLQPIAVEDVAVRLSELVEQAPANGRAPDIGGPERRRLPELAREWAAARRSRRPIMPLRVPGKTFRAYAGGAALVDGPTYGTITFAEYLG
ncbi:NAD(P)H-binding protein [Kribbella sp. NPDC023972]|uniref:SDR family oxidoreductase n=1 Tax=Kribbella sp. NPDC023972 TaxID=3154795 RepID=UPI0033ED19D7